MKEKHLYVDTSASNSMSSLNSILKIIAWICLIAGVFSIFIGLNQGIMGVWIIGISLICVSISFFTTIPIISGLIRITECAEYYKAKMEATYAANAEKQNNGMNDEIDKWLKNEQ